MRLLLVIVSAFCMTLAAVAADEPALTAEQVLAKSKEAYAALQTYQSEGVVEMEISQGGRDVLMKVFFEMQLQKPNRYLVKWRSEGPGAAGGAVGEGAVWSDGTQPYVYLSYANGYMKLQQDAMALAAATGVSGGAASVVPMLMLDLPAESQHDYLALHNATIDSVQALDGEACYVIKGASSVWKETTIWISKESFLLRKYAHTYEPVDGAMAKPELTDQQLDEAIRQLGQEVNDESRARMRAVYKQGMQAMKNLPSGQSTQTHRVVSLPGPDEQDFEFKPPEGVVLKESLFGGVLKPMPKPGQ